MTSWHVDPAGLEVPSDWPRDAFAEWAYGGATGAGVRVCVVDSGIDGGHADVGPVTATYAMVGGRAVPDEQGDRSGHGTACASVIRRLAPDCELVGMRVLGRLHGRAEVLVEGLRWAVGQGFDVINLSLSTTRRDFVPALRELADEAYAGNTLIVAAAHNLPVESYPWRFSSVVSVGSHHEPEPDLILYNPSPPVEFFARGVNVPVATPGGGRRRRSGNSFATPHVAARCALIRGKHPGLTPFQVKTALYLSSSNVMSH
ncbi:Subtilase family protein [Nonomuraea solani]|uniref:Subtilase family protein n=1 Tax=Nonomuraea solani TaxID=1144553 RepID=A0A1H5W9B0_9ACTN|nr:S8 family serine peptidase [Nonomuraea solani]SEF95983.1 Subtilase family protein [Nonomuraea solani]